VREREERVVSLREGARSEPRRSERGALSHGAEEES
jgi:hypothetical protein